MTRCPWISSLFSNSQTSVLSFPAPSSEFGGRKGQTIFFLAVPGHLLQGDVVPTLLFDGAVFSTMGQFQDVLERLPCWGLPIILVHCLKRIKTSLFIGYYGLGKFAYCFLLTHNLSEVLVSSSRESKSLSPCLMVHHQVCCGYMAVLIDSIRIISQFFIWDAA